MLQITSLIADELKSSGGKIDKIGLSPLYAETVKLWQSVRMHCDVNSKPSEILQRKFPNETQEEYDYRISNYEPITPSFWNKALGTVNRIWNKQNYNIDFKDSEDGEYFKTDYPVYGNIEEYFKSIVTNQKVNDPNSVLCISLYEIPQTEDGEPDQAKMLEPVAYLYGSENVVFFEDENYTLILSEEKSEVKENNKTVKSGLVFKLFTNKEIIKIYQVGKKLDWRFEDEMFYEHNLGYVPTWKLRGIPVYFQNYLLYHSYFIGAIPLLNKAVSLDTTLDTAIAKHAYPIRAYYYEPCNAQGCDHGKITDYSCTPAKLSVCSTCQGSGELIRFSPHKDFKIKIPDANFEGEGAQFPGITYVEPPTNNMDWTKKTLYDYIDAAFTFLNIDVSNSDVRGSETALGKKIDREELFSFLILFANEIFHLLKEVIDAIGTMRYGVSWVAPSITIPNEFSIKDSASLTEEYANGQSKELPSFAMGKLFDEYVSQRFGKDEFTMRINQIASLADPYITFSNQDLIGRKAAGIIEAWNIILHDNIGLYIKKKLVENDKFLEGKDLEIVSQLSEMAKADAVLLPGNQMTTKNLLFGA